MWHCLYITCAVDWILQNKHTGRGMTCRTKGRKCRGECGWNSCLAPSSSTAMRYRASHSHLIPCLLHSSASFLRKVYRRYTSCVTMATGQTTQRSRRCSHGRIVLPSTNNPTPVFRIIATCHPIFLLYVIGKLPSCAIWTDNFLLGTEVICAPHHTLKAQKLLYIQICSTSLILNLSHRDLWVLHGRQIKEWLFSYAPLTDWPL